MTKAYTDPLSDGRQADAPAEITPEMIEAGMRVLLNKYEDCPSWRWARHVAEEVYRAMTGATAKD